MADSVLDHMTRLRLKLLEKKLENERIQADERADTVLSTRSRDGQEDALRRALKRKMELLQKLRHQRMLEDLSRPRTWDGTRRRYKQEAPRAPPPTPPPMHTYQAPPGFPTVHMAPPPPPQLPRVFQHTVPQQPTTIIQQLPQQQPLIAQIPPPQSFPPSKAGSIKEDMVELMLMQNAQMHQIIMHNMMLKAIPPAAFSPAGGASQATPTRYHMSPHQQESNLTTPIVVRPEKHRGGSVHHHHHYGPPAALPPIGYSAWSPAMPSAGQEGTYQPTMHHVTGPITLPPLNTCGRFPSQNPYGSMKYK